MNIHYSPFPLVHMPTWNNKFKCLKGRKASHCSRVTFPPNSRSLRLAFINIKQDLRTLLRELAQPIKYHSQFLICPNHLTEKQRLAARQEIKYSNTQSALVILTFELYLLHIWPREKHPTFRFTFFQNFVSRCTCKPFAWEKWYTGKYS